MLCSSSNDYTEQTNKQDHFDYQIIKIEETKDNYLITVKRDNFFYTIISDNTLKSVIPPANASKIEIGETYTFVLKPLFGNKKLLGHEVISIAPILRISEYTELYLRNNNTDFMGYYLTDGLKGLYYVPCSLQCEDTNVEYR